MNNIILDDILSEEEMLSLIKSEEDIINGNIFSYDDSVKSLKEKLYSKYSNEVC